MLTKSLVTAIAVTLILTCVGGAVAGEPYDERINPVFDEREWVVAHADASREELVVEYILKGESIEGWTEMVTTILVPVKFQPEVLPELRDYYHDGIRKQCAELNWQVVSSSDTMVVCAWDLEPCLDSAVEYTLTAFRKGVLFTHLLTYSARDKERFEEQKPGWLQRLKKARAFYAEESGPGPLSGHLEDSTKMIRISYHYDSPALADDAFMRQPRKIWRSGSKYFRSEEKPDTARGIHGLMITNEPDAWIVNRMNNQGRHMVDQGPTFNTVCPVFGEVRQDGLSKLEFGQERAFFEHHAARQLPEETVDGIECEVYELPRLYWILRLYVNKKTGLPYLITRRGPDNTTDSVYFESYEVNLELDRGLFQPPDDVEFVEG